MDKILKNRELVSALADSDLQGEDFALAVEAAVQDGDARATWHAYHLVGDALRASDLTQCLVKDDFMGRLQARLQAENLVPKPSASIAVAMPEVVAPVRLSPAANASVFRWKLVAGFASMAAVVAVGWNVLGTGGEPGGATLASAARTPMVAPTLVALPAGNATPGATLAVSNDQPMVMIRDPHLDALLAAHKQFGGTSALQAPAGFLRNATFEQR